MLKLLSEPKRKLFQLLLEDKRVSSIVLCNEEEPKAIRVNEDGSVTFGRTPKHWWNWFWNDEITKDFETVCIRMIKAYNKYLPPGSGLTSLLTEEVVKNAVETNNYESVVDRFVMYAFLGVTEGDYKLNKLKLIDEGTQQQNNRREQKTRVSARGLAYIDFGGGQIPMEVDIESYQDGIIYNYIYQP